MPWTSNKITKGALFQARRKAKVDTGFRSKLEERVAKQLDASGVPYAYESSKIKYTVPSRQSTYLVDFHLNNKIVIESKGYFRSADERQKYILIKKCNPSIDLRFVFQDAKKKIYKGSPTTYAAWATKNGFLWSDLGIIPDTWLSEAV